MTAFLTWPFKATSGVTSRTLPDRLKDTISTKECGAIADGSSHPLSSTYANLAAAQAVYPFATSLSQEIDYCACQLASNLAFGAAGSENAASAYLNKRVRINAGNYQFGSSTWKISKLHSAIIEGDGMFVTTIFGSSIVLQTDGCWYTTFRQFTLQSTSGTAVAVFDLDGNVDHTYTTNGVQGCTLEDMTIVGAGSTYGLAVCRQGSSFGQGSENNYLNLHFQSGGTACYYQLGFNALDNKFIGGDMQSYSTNGALIVLGTCDFYGMSFESVTGYTQYLNNGYDIQYNSGAISGCTVIGCRSESMQFFFNDGGSTVAIVGCIGQNAMNSWAANTTEVVGNAIQVSGTVFPDVQGRVFVVTAVTGDAKTGATAPTWTTDGSSVTDNHVTWIETGFNWINNTSGSVDLATTKARAGRILFPYTGAGQLNVVTANYTLSVFDRVIAVDATAGPITITIPAFPYPKALGREYIIKKIDTSANSVTVQSQTVVGAGAFQFEGGGSTDTIAGGSRGYRHYVIQGQHGGTAPPWIYTIGTG